MSDEADREVPDGVAVFPEIPAELNVHPLLLALLHCTVFLDGSDDGIVDPAAAEEMLHYIASYLQRLKGDELRRVKEDMLTLATYAKQQGWAKEEVRYLKEFLRDFGVSAGEKEE
jgi:hypothetical protein